MEEVRRIIRKVEGLLTSVYETEKPELRKIGNISSNEELLEYKLKEMSSYLRNLGSVISENLNKVAGYLERESGNIMYLKGAREYAKELAMVHPEGGRILSLVENVEKRTRENAYEEFNNLFSAIRSFVDAANRFMEAFEEYNGPSKLFRDEMEKVKA